MPKVIAITIVQTDYSPDKLMLTFDITEGTYPFESKAVAMMEVAAAQGPTYAKVNFPDVPVLFVNDYRGK